MTVTLGLREAVSAIDDWLAARLFEFDIFTWSNAEEAENRRKACAELAIYLYVTHGLPISAPGAMHDRVRAITSDSRFLELLFRDRVHFSLYAPFFVYGRRMGALAPEMERFLGCGLIFDEMAANECPPNRMLEIRHFLTAIGIDANYPAACEIQKFGCLGYRVNPFSCGMQTAYALTHAIFYLSDFGAHSIDFPGAANAMTVTQVLALRFLAEENYDLAIELGICLLTCGAGYSIARLIAGKAVEKISRTGVAPVPPELSGGWIDEFPSDSREWCRHYHTMLVAGIFLRMVGAREEALTSAGEVSEPVAIVLGKAFSELHSYNLRDASIILSQLVAMPECAPFEACVAQAARFIAAQKRTDGGFGYFPDERVVLENLHGAFEASSMLAENDRSTRLACEQFLNRVAQNSPEAVRC
jgi:hypothetical protein